MRAARRLRASDLSAAGGRLQFRLVIAVSLRPDFPRRVRTGLLQGLVELRFVLVEFGFNCSFRRTSRGWPLRTFSRSWTSMRITSPFSGAKISCRRMGISLPLPTTRYSQGTKHNAATTNAATARIGQRLGQLAAVEPFQPVPQLLPQPQKQDAVLPAGMREDRSHMLGQQGGPFFEARAGPAVGRLLDHQATDDLARSRIGGRTVIFRIVAIGSGVPARSSGMSLTSREPLSWMKLPSGSSICGGRLSIRPLKVSGSRSATIRDGDGGHGPRQIGAGIDLVLAADGDDRGLAALVHGDAQPVAAQKLPPVVGGGRGDLGTFSPRCSCRMNCSKSARKLDESPGVVDSVWRRSRYARRVAGHLFDELQKTRAAPRAARRAVGRSRRPRRSPRQFAGPPR